MSSRLLFLPLTLLLCSCGLHTGSNTEPIDTIPPIEPLSATPLPSAEDVKYEVEVYDTLTPGTLTSLDDPYADAPGIFTFRGGPLRDANFGGTVSHKPQRIVQRWVFETEEDFTKTQHGTWGGGTGWTGQPVYVAWPDSAAQRFSQEGGGLTGPLPHEEIIVGSLCEKVYFIDFATGKASRTPLETTNPIKGSVSLAPDLSGLLLVGQGIPKVPPMGRLAFNLFSHKQTYFSGADHKAWLGWQANDSSPLVLGGFVFWPSENGTVYKYLVHDGTVTPHSALQWAKASGHAGGIENSMCAYRNYGFVGNNVGDILCFDLNTLRPIWHYDNHDDIDASIVCEVEGDTPYIYCCSEVDRQGDAGTAYFVKLNGLTGEPVWENRMPCTKLIKFEKHFDGGFYSTPLPGRGNCAHLIFTDVCQHEGSDKAEFTAFRKDNGEVAYRVQLASWAWSSPVAFYGPNGEMYIFAGDTAGYASLIDGLTGEVLFKEHLVNNFESSPVVVGNEFVVGSRGKQIYKFAVE